jgi:hypothetical protein
MDAPLPGKVAGLRANSGLPAAGPARIGGRVKQVQCEDNAAIGPAGALAPFHDAKSQGALKAQQMVRRFRSIQGQSGVGAAARPGPGQAQQGRPDAAALKVRIETERTCTGGAGVAIVSRLGCHIRVIRGDCAHQLSCDHGDETAARTDA